MSATVVNLRRARKSAERGEREAEAAANRVRYGRSKGERAQDALEAARSERVLDGARLAVAAGDLSDANGG